MVTEKPLVLLVEDDPASLAGLKKAFGDLGLTFVHALSSKALDMAGSTDFAVIVLALTSPGIAGLQTAHLIRALAPAAVTPFLFLTPFGWKDCDTAPAYALGSVEIMSRPLNPLALKSKISFFVDLYNGKQALKQARQEAADDHAFLAAVLDTVEDAIVACDAQGVLTLFNRASRVLHGLSEQPLPPEHWASYYGLFRADGVTPLPTHEIPLLRALAGEHVLHAEMMVASPEVGLRLLDATGRPLIDGQGTKWGAVVSMHDLTAQQEAERAREGTVREQAARQAAEIAAMAVRESTERFSLLLNSSAEGIYGMAPDSSCTFLNKAGAHMLGYEPEELVGRPIHDIIHHHLPDGTRYPRSACKIGKASRAGTFIRVDDEVFWHKNGSAVAVSYSVNPMVVADQNAGSVITFTDITQRRQVEEALRASNERVKLATDAGGLGLYTWDIATDEVTWHNDRPHEIFGLPKSEEPINATRFTSQFLHPDDAPLFSTSMSLTLSEGSPLLFQGRIYRQPDREVRWVEFTGQVEKAAYGAVSRVVGTVSDVTRRKQAEDALRESEERLRQLANTIPNLAWTANADGWITWYNDRWYAYTGTTPSEMEGWGWQKVHDPEILPEAMRQWTGSIETGRQFEMTFPLRGADGVFRPFFTKVAPLRDSTGQIVQWFGTNTDVSPLKKAEADLLQADRRKDEFLAMLAHELRNPLAPIRNAAELLHRLNSADERVKRASEIIVRQVNHMSGLLNDLLDVSRVTRGLISLEMQRVDLATAIASAVEQVRPLINARQHHLSLHGCHLGIYVLASSLRLTQVIANLLDNAAKYSPSGGTITVEVSLDGEQVRIAVSDTGIGITPELMPYVFEPFSQAERGADRSQGGLGLGLAVVKGLVELHGGSVRATSGGNGMGSRFEVVLPLYKKTTPADADMPVAMADAASRDALRVLIVDDNVDAAETLAFLLQAAGHWTRVAFNGTQALEFVAHDPFDVAILDIGLPDITGYDLARRILASTAVAPMLLALSGYGQAEDRAAAVAAGFSHHLVKPVEPDTLLEMLSTHRGQGGRSK